jgi:penicillin-binding protein 2
MSRDLERQRQFTRRALVLGAGKAAALAVLAGRLYYLQITQSERYLTLSDENRITLRLIAPRRGRILDRWVVLSPTIDRSIAFSWSPNALRASNRRSTR